jgi:hypothetical protein
VTKGIVKGKTYTFRYRAINMVGAGAWSDYTPVVAAGIPTAPPSPTYVSSTDSTITLAFQLSSDNGGSLILNYIIKVDDGALGPITNIVGDYDGASSTHMISGLTAGLKYRFQYYAHNSYGDSLPSSIITVAASVLPVAPGIPTIDWTLSSKTSLNILWPAVADPPSPIVGYILLMDNGRGGSYSTVFDGSFQPGVTKFLVSGLTNGFLYSFKVYAANYNGRSLAASPVAQFYACTTPGGFPAPTVIYQSTSSIELQWTQPTSSGGCQIIGYAVLRDDGAGGTITTEVNSANDIAVRLKPSLNTLVVTSFPAGVTDGFTFRFIVQVFTT